MQHRKKVHFFENWVKKLILNINSAAKFKTKFGIIYNVIKIASRCGRIAAPCMFGYFASRGGEIHFRLLYRRFAAYTISEIKNDKTIAPRMSLGKCTYR